VKSSTFLLASLLGPVMAAGPLHSAFCGVREFAEEHCLECHDTATHKAGLDLETQVFRPGERVSELVWEAVFDRVARGEMPPQKKEQPAVKDREAFLEELGRGLHEASQERQAREGRGPVRRLTRLEYETTVNDLLHICSELGPMFPEDAVTAGFDKVGAGLTLSSAHFAAYQDAAERALQLAVLRGGVLDSDRDGIALFNARPNEFSRFGGWLEGDAMAVASRFFFPYTAIHGPEAPRSGRYRITFTASARGNGGKPLPVAIGVEERSRVKPDAPETRLWVDVPEGMPQTVSVELECDRGEYFHLFGPTLVHRDVFMPRFQKEGKWEGPVLLLSRVKIEGPLTEDGGMDPWPGAAFRGLFDQLPAAPLSKISGLPPEKGKPDPWFPVSAAPKEDAARLLRRFLPRAFRRPVSEQDAAVYVNGVHEALDAGVPFHRAMLDGYKAVLCSPHFILLEEKPGLLDGHAVANRLSYFLWNSAPDEKLTLAASAGELATPEGRRVQVERMLRDSRVRRFEQSFVDQWLDLKNLNATAPDGVLYAEIKPEMTVAAGLETRRFFHEMLEQNRSVLESIQSDWTYVNELLSDLYGLPEVSGYELRRVSLPEGSRRGGFLTQASVLKVTADGAKTSPILRGKWVNERLLGIVPPAPPEDVQKIEPDIRGATTIREQLARHRSSPSCMGCHAVLDPPGFALENYDVMGGWREFYRARESTGVVLELARFGGRRVHRGPAVEKGYTMPDGRAFADIDAYKALLMEDRERIVYALAGKLLTYATGAPPQFADRESLKAIVAGLREQNFGLRSLIHAIVESRPFLYK
jgi:hypothetical protein